MRSVTSTGTATVVIVSTRAAQSGGRCPNWSFHFTRAMFLIFLSTALLQDILIYNENLVLARAVTVTLNINTKSTTQLLRGATSESGLGRTRSRSRGATDSISSPTNPIEPHGPHVHEHERVPASALHGLRFRFRTATAKNNNVRAHVRAHDHDDGAILLLYPGQRGTNNTNKSKNTRTSVNNTNTSTIRQVLGTGDEFRRNVPVSFTVAVARGVGASFPGTFPTTSSQKEAAAVPQRKTEPETKRNTRTARFTARRLVSKSSSFIHDLSESLQIISANGSESFSSSRSHPSPQYELSFGGRGRVTDTGSINDIHDGGSGKGDQAVTASATVTRTTIETTTPAQIFMRTHESAAPARGKRSTGYFNTDLAKSEDYDKSLRLFLFLGGLAISFFVLIFISTLLCFCCPFCLIAKRSQRSHFHGGRSLDGSGAIFQSSSGPETTFTVTGPAAPLRSSSIQMNTSPLLGPGGGPGMSLADRRASSYQPATARMSQDFSGLSRSPRPSTSQQGGRGRLSISGYNVLPYGFDPSVLPSTPPQSLSPRVVQVHDTTTTSSQSTS